MNKILWISTFCFTSILFSNVTLYWDLGLGITKFETHNHQEDLLKLSTFNRIEGLKKYYNQNFEDAIYYFQQLNNNQLNYVLYEYANAYYELNKPQEAALLLSNYNNNSLDDNLIYLKSKIFTEIQDYRLALENLQYLKNHFPESSYRKILIFDIEKINLLAQ